MKLITESTISDYEKHLVDESKSSLTIKKYIYYINHFASWLDKKSLQKDHYEKYIHELRKSHAISTVNMAISALNSFFEYNKWAEYKTPQIKQKRRTQCDALTREEYNKLLSAAQKINDKRLFLIMKTFCATGIRVSEIKYITVEALKKGSFETIFKGVKKNISFPHDLKQQLINFAEAENITKGCIFITKNGTPLDRSRICKELKNLCIYTDVPREKVCPDSIRFLPIRHISENIMRNMIY